MSIISYNDHRMVKILSGVERDGWENGGLDDDGVAASGRLP